MPIEFRLYPTKESFVKRFTNRELELPSPFLYKFLQREWTEQYFNRKEMGEELLTLYQYTVELQGLARLYENACNPNKMAKRYRIVTDGPLIEIQKGIQNAILSCLDSLYRRIDKHTILEALEPEYKKSFELWNSYLKGMPYPEEIRENANGHLLSDEVMDEIMTFIDRAPKDMIESVTISEDDVIKNFLRYAIKLGIKMNSEVYRELYECLEEFSLIPSEQYHSHMKNSSPYVRENYIKMKVKRLQ